MTATELRGAGEPATAGALVVALTELVATGGSLAACVVVGTVTGWLVVGAWAVGWSAAGACDVAGTTGLGGGACVGNAGASCTEAGTGGCECCTGP